MDQITLRAAERTESGSRPARRLRRAGLVPATIYGRGMDARSVTLDIKELFSALHTEAGLNALIDVQGAEQIRAALVAIKDWKFTRFNSAVSISWHWSIGPRTRTSGWRCAPAARWSRL